VVHSIGKRSWLVIFDGVACWRDRSVRRGGGDRSDPGRLNYAEAKKQETKHEGFRSPFHVELLKFEFRV
jgi:hypothetical protein